MDKNNPYQLTRSQNYAINEIMDKFSNNINPICALTVGMGKTIIACEIIKKLMLQGCEKIIVIARANNLTDPWMTILNEYKIKYFMIHGKERLEKRINEKYHLIRNSIILTSQDTAALDIKYIMSMGIFDLLVIDEVHAIVNPKKITRKSCQLAKIESVKKLFLSATPIQNKREDLALIYIMLNKPKEFPLLLQYSETNKQRLDMAYSEALEKKIIVQPVSEANNNDIKSKSVLRKKRIILSIPIYKEMEDYIEKNRDYLMGQNRGKKTHSQRLEQFLSHPSSVFKNNTYFEGNPIKGSIKCGKVDAVDAILINIPREEKLIIFSRYKDVLFQYSKLLKRRGHKTITMTGDDRAGLEKKINLFKKSDSFNILLTTLFKSAEGLNLPEANHVIVLEFWWNPQKVLQAMGRIDRHNQKKDIFIFLLCYNKNGKMIETDSEIFEKMEKKNKEAKNVLNAQPELPAIETFADEKMFIYDLHTFLQEKFLQEITYLDSNLQYGDIILE
jgi:superfamily II DNA or RNA helicase